MMAAKTIPALHKLVAECEVTSFVQRCMVAAGVPAPHAAIVAEVLIAADVRGHYSHGVNRLEMYCDDVQSGRCDGAISPVVVKETTSTAFVDGRNGIGMVIGCYCMDLAIKKAKETGIGWVTCTGSNHYGIAGYYGLQAVEQGLIGMSFTNTSPLVVPTRAKQAMLGTNPICFAAPAGGGDSFVLDMATSTAAVGKVEIQHRKELPIPSGWGVDRHGEETHDPKVVLKEGGGLMPLGGGEESAGYKGYGLAMMVEVICGLMSGGPYANHIRKWQTEGDPQPANLGQTYMALDPRAFAPSFEGRMSTFMQELRQMEPKDSGMPVLVAGDPERKHTDQVKQAGGILYHDNVIAALNQLAVRLKVEPLKIVTQN